MRALCINDEVRARIAALVAHADVHRVDQRRMARILEQVDRPVGDDPRHAMEIPQGYRCVYSIEEHLAGWCRHLSVSVDAPGKCPSPESLAILLEEFGFSKGLARVMWSGGHDWQADARVWLEDHRAVNVVEPL